MNEEKLNTPDDVVEAVRKLANENCALAAGQCIVPGALQGDDGGMRFCNMERRLINQRAANTTLEYTLNKALAARDSARAKCDEAIVKNTRLKNTNAFLEQVREANADALAKMSRQLNEKQETIDNYAAELADTRGILHNASAQITVKDYAIHDLETRKRNLVEENAALHRSIEELKAKLTNERRGAVVITTGSDGDGEILAVTRQDADGKMLKVLAEAPERPQGGLSLAQARELRDLAKDWLRASLYAVGKNNTVDTIAAIEKRKAFFAALTELTTPAAGNDTARIAELENARREMRDRCVAVAERRRKEHEKNTRYWADPPEQDRFGADAARDRCNAREAAVHEVISDINALEVTA